MRTPSVVFSGVPGRFYLGWIDSSPSALAPTVTSVTTSETRTFVETRIRDPLPSVAVVDVDGAGTPTVVTRHTTTNPQVWRYEDDGYPAFGVGILCGVVPQGYWPDDGDVAWALWYPLVIIPPTAAFRPAKVNFYNSWG